MMNEVMFGLSKVYKDGILSSKHWMSVDGGDIKEVTADTYYKLDIDEFEKIKNVDIKKIPPKATSSKKVKKQVEEEVCIDIDQVSDNLVEMIRENDAEAMDMVREFLLLYFADAREIGYISALNDITQITERLKTSEPMEE